MHKKVGGEGEKEKDWGRVGERERERLNLLVLMKPETKHLVSQCTV